MAFPVRYMGSKRSLASQICQHITDANPKASVLDVFSGMCAVGAELAPKHRLLTNDAHTFAKIVAEALFVAPRPRPTSLNARVELGDAYAANAARLRELSRSLLQAEVEALGRIEGPGGWKRLLALNDEQLKVDLPNYPDGCRPGAFPYSLTVSYFAFGYFGVAQAIEIDSLRYAIDKAPLSSRAYYLSCLMRAASECAAAPGHFAQFLVPRDKKTTLYIARIRRRSILDRFYRALDEFPEIACWDRPGNHAYCNDATQLLESFSKASGIDRLIVYADPPYSRAQYSRYYHVLETLAKYDYPSCNGKGRYRDDRFATGFSLKAKVAGEMRRFLRASSDINAQVYLSYPDNGLLYKTGEDLEGLMREFYPKVERVANVPLSHSTMGGAPGKASMVVMEDVYRGYF